MGIVGENEENSSGAGSCTYSCVQVIGVLSKKPRHHRLCSGEYGGVVVGTEDGWPVIKATKVTIVDGKSTLPRRRANLLLSLPGPSQMPWISGLECNTVIAYLNFDATRF